MFVIIGLPLFPQTNKQQCTISMSFFSSRIYTWFVAFERVVVADAWIGIEIEHRVYWWAFVLSITNIYRFSVQTHSIQLFCYAYEFCIAKLKPKSKLILLHTESDKIHSDRNTDIPNHNNAFNVTHQCSPGWHVDDITKLCFWQFYETEMHIYLPSNISSVFTHVCFHDSVFCWFFFEGGKLFYRIFISFFILLCFFEL